MQSLVPTSAGKTFFQLCVILSAPNTLGFWGFFGGFFFFVCLFLFLVLLAWFYFLEVTTQAPGTEPFHILFLCMEWQIFLIHLPHIAFWTLMHSLDLISITSALNTFLWSPESMRFFVCTSCNCFSPLENLSKFLIIYLFYDLVFNCWLPQYTVSSRNAFLFLLTIVPPMFSS